MSSRRVTQTSAASRGLSPGAAVAVAGVLSLAGALFDILSSPGLGLVFGCCFTAGCVLAALTVCRRGLGTVAVMPPLVYVVIALIAGGVNGTHTGGSWLMRQGLDLLTALVLQAPALLIGTAAAVVLTLVRGLGRRRAPAPVEQPVAPSYV